MFIIENIYKKFHTLRKIMSSITKRTLKKDWILTAEAFEKFLFSLDSNLEKASFIYEDIRNRLIRQFRANQSQFAEEQADEVFNRVARKVFEEGFLLNKENPYPYFHTTARYILLEYQKKSRQKVLGIEDLSPAQEPYFNPEVALEKYTERIEKEIGLQSLAECKQSLPEKDRELLEKYDAAKGKDKKQQRDLLADSLGKTKNALKISVNRIRNKLIECARKKINMKLF